MIGITDHHRCQRKSLQRDVIQLLVWTSAALLTIGFCAIGKSRDRPDTPTQGSVPILVELFTSEGCSSCPPADAMLEKLDTQPIPGAQLIVLSEHVDYWNHDGWKDPYSSSAVTERQNDYVSALKLKTAYTPQIIVDGTSVLQLDDPQQVKQVFETALTGGTLAVRIVSLDVEPGTPTVVRGRVEVDEDSERHDAEVYVVAALDRAESQVLRGENSGRHLAHVAVVQQFQSIAKIEKGKGVGQDFELKLKPGTDPTNVRIVVFVQQSGPGKVLGAALRKIEN